MTLNNTQVDESNKFYKKQDNSIINKETENKIIEFAIYDNEYCKKDMLAKKLYGEMIAFLDEYRDYSIENLDDAFKKFLKCNTKSEKKIVNRRVSKRMQRKSYIVQRN